MPRHWITFSVAATAVFMASLDGTLVPVALSDIEDSLGVSTTAVSWVLTAFTITNASLLVASGRVGDRMGRKRVFLFGLAMMSVGSALAGLSTELWMLVGARILMAAGAAFLLPASLGLTLAVWPKGETTKAIAAWTAVGAVAGAIGPTLGAALVNGPGWRSAFYINVVLGVPALFVGTRVLVDTKRLEGRGLPDPVGIVLIIVVLCMATLGLVQGRSWGWTDPRVFVSLVVPFILLPVFVRRCRTHPSPVLDLPLLGLRSYRQSLVVALLIPMALFANFILMIQFLERRWDYSVLEAGIAVLPFPVLASGIALVAGRLSLRFDERRFVIGGLAMELVAIVWFATVPTEDPAYWTTFFPGVVLVGAGGWGFALSMINSVTARELSDENYGVGMGIQSTFRQIGSLVGLSVVFGLLGPDGDAADLDLFREIWWVLAAIAAVGLLSALRLPPRPAVVVTTPAAAPAGRARGRRSSISE